MATVRPFKAIRPTVEYADKVAALPYDVMNSDEAREMVRDNPHSFLHVDKAEIDLPRDVDPYDNQVYQKAKENLDALRAKGILAQDGEAMLYIYRLIMNGRAQTGIVCCVSIDEYMDGTIKKHELTRADKEQDRINHVNICDANTGPIFLTYKAGTNEVSGSAAPSDIESAVRGWTDEKAPVYDFQAEDGISHQVWVIDDRAVTDTICRAFQDVPNLYIADGHHRNASAVKVGLMRREENPEYDSDAEFNYYLSVIFPDKEMYIMDYNRVVKDLNGLSEDEFLAAVGESFRVEVVAARCKPESLHSFGMYLNHKWYALTVKEELIGTDPVEALDVSILQRLLLEPVLEIKNVTVDKRIDFVGGIRGLGELERRVDSGEMRVAFAMYPTSIRELMSVADAGSIMPPKSTWFEPKLRSGLFIHSLE